MLDMPDPRASVASLFDRTAEDYDAVGSFVVFAKALLADTGLKPGDRVLDVGCGRGAVLFAAAEQVGAAGSVLGIDLSPAMIERTAADIAERGVTRVEVAVMDAQEPSLDGREFDAVVAAAVLFFLPDPMAALRAWHSVLVPGGRLGVTTFGGNDPRFVRVAEVFAPYVPPALAWALLNPASPFASTENLEHAVTEAGFGSVSTVVREHLMTFADPDEWMKWSWSHGQRVFWELIPEAELPDARAKIVAALEDLREPDGRLVMVQTVRYTVANRPA